MAVCDPYVECTVCAQKNLIDEELCTIDPLHGVNLFGISSVRGTSF